MKELFYESICIPLWEIQQFAPEHSLVVYLLGDQYLHHFHVGYLLPVLGVSAPSVDLLGVFRSLVDPRHGHFVYPLHTPLLAVLYFLEKESRKLASGVLMEWFLP